MIGYLKAFGWGHARCHEKGKMDKVSCPKCGKPNPADTVKCIYCGARLR